MGFRTQIAGEEDGLSSISDINVTPFVDVVLVLLVIFMITAPLIMKDTLGIRLPKTVSGEGKKVSTLAFAITKNGNVLINGQLGSQPEVLAAVNHALKENPQVQAILSADHEARHGDVVRVIDWVKTAGLSRFAIQIERKKDAKAD